MVFDQLLLIRDQELMTNLQRVLQQFYMRKGKELIFINGMNLNQLALAIWEQGGNGMDASVLSKIVNGKRLFTNQQLRVFCQVLKLAPGKRQLLIKSVQQSILSKKGFGWE